MNFKSKLEKLFNLQHVKDAPGSEVYLVSWTARYGEYYYDTKRVAQAFFSHDDAKQFAKSLEEAQKLLQNTNSISVTITKQQ
jgi:hypothetical protein